MMAMLSVMDGLAAEVTPLPGGVWVVRMLDTDAGETYAVRRCVSYESAMRLAYLFAGEVAK
jgi:hypothetical protein